MAITHGKSRTRLYNVWGHMLRRCYATNNDRYHRYGGRGIRVHAGWHDFQAFYKWAMESGYKEGLTLERLNNDADYMPQNCVWATKKVQANNRRDSHRLTVDGTTKTVAEWADSLDVDQDRLYNRLRRGWSAERTIKTPLPRRGSSGQEVRP